MEWENEDIIKFLEAYQGEPCIWNPKHIDHKDKKKVADAWTHLSTVMEKPVSDLKKKKEALMATFRKHLNKKQDSIRSGAGVQDIYKPIWFAYDLMESFLLPRYSCNKTINTETQSQQNVESTAETENDSEVIEVIEDDEAVSNAPSQASTSRTQSQRPRRRPASSIAETQMATAFGQLTNVLSERRSASQDDDCDLYSKLLAKKLRELPSDERKHVMYQIDGIFIDRINRKMYMHHTPSPQNYSRPPSVPNQSRSRSSSMLSSHSDLSPSIQYTPSFPQPITTAVSKPIPHILNQQNPTAESSTRPIILSEEIIQPTRIQSPELSANYSRPPSVPNQSRSRPSSKLSSHSDLSPSIQYTPSSSQTITTAVSKPIPHILNPQNPTAESPTRPITLSEEIIKPRFSEHDILSQALLKTYEEFENNN